MGGINDPEKGTPALFTTMAQTSIEPENKNRQPSSTSTGVSTDQEMEKELEKEIHVDRRSRHAASSHETDSINSNDSDPLEPLERALTPDQQTPEEHMARPFRSYTTTSIGTNGSRIPDFEIDFEENDPRNPRNWPRWYRGCILAAVSWATWIVVLYSTSYTSGMPLMMEEFHEDSTARATLGVTSYLLGLAAGSLVLAPLSEIWGRRPIYVASMLLFIVFIIPCGLSQNLDQIIGVRFLGALAGSAMIANAPGTVMDISREENRALAFSIWSIGPMNGPVTGPLIGGFTAQYLGWRWTNWLVMILGGIAWIVTAVMKETYAPAILQKMAAERRRETGDDRWWCRYDVKVSITRSLKINLSRPFVLTLTEPILWFWDLYIAVVYGILYLCFVAYPLIFSGYRGWSAGMSGLAFAGIGVGTTLVIVTEPLARKIINLHPKDPETGKVSPEASVSLVCVAALLVPIGQLWFSWTSYPISIHWIWGILAGIPFGAGNGLVFIYAGNYISSSYGIYSASAMAGNAVIRSLVGGTLPLAGTALFNTMGPNWAGTFLGLLEVLLIPIPFVFYKWGSNIREKSPVIRQMRADQDKINKRAERNEMKRGRQVDAEKGEVVDVQVQEGAEMGLVKSTSRIQSGIKP